VGPRARGPALAHRRLVAKPRSAGGCAPGCARPRPPPARRAGVAHQRGEQAWPSRRSTMRGLPPTTRGPTLLVVPRSIPIEGRPPLPLFFRTPATRTARASPAPPRPPRAPGGRVLAVTRRTRRGPPLPSDCRAPGRRPGPGAAGAESLIESPRRRQRAPVGQQRGEPADREVERAGPRRALRQLQSTCRSHRARKLRRLGALGRAAAGPG
jgi:hypothetical protein